MLGAAALLLQLTLWAATVQAFFPFIPDDPCGPGENCGSGPKRTQVGSATSEVITLDLIQRPRDVCTITHPAYRYRWFSPDIDYSLAKK